MKFSTLIIILLVIAFALRIDFIFYVIYVSIGVYGWSRWATPHALKRLHSRRIYNQYAFWDEQVPVTIELENSSYVPLPWVRLSESVALELKRGVSINEVFSLRHKKTLSFTYMVQARRRGYYQIGPTRISTSDLFGMQKELAAWIPAEHLTVYPRIIPLTQLGLPSRLPFGTVSSHQRLFEDPARPMGVRQFRSGDSLRQINWKASAHTRNLVVKTYEPAISLETAVLLDLHSPAYTRQNRQNYIEWSIEVAASLSAHLIEQRQAVGLMTNGIDPLTSGAGPQFDENTGRLLRQEMPNLAEKYRTYLPPVIPPRNGRYHLIKLLERLARIESETTIPLEAWAAEATAHLSWGVTILTITPRGSEPICQTLHRLVRSGFNPVLIVTEPDSNFSLVRERARRLGFSAYHVTNIHDLDAWRRPQQVTW